MEDNRILRPWGYYEVLVESDNYKIKRITVFPKQKTSLQFHKLRNEYWIIVQGKLYFIDYETNYYYRKQDGSIFIEKNKKHRIENKEEDNLIIIEVQTGICKEEDIIRLEDDYGRI